MPFFIHTTRMTHLSKICMHNHKISHREATRSHFLMSSNSRNRYRIYRCCVCVCVFARVCVCVRARVFPFFHREGFFRLQNVQDILEGNDQRSCVVNISCVLYAKFHHLRIWKCHISPSKTKTPARNLLERKRYDLMCSTKR